MRNETFSRSVPRCVFNSNNNNNNNKPSIVFKMPDRFKVTKTDAAEIDATYNSILKDEEAAAVLGKLLPPSSEKKGEFIFNSNFFLCHSIFFHLVLWFLDIYTVVHSKFEERMNFKWTRYASTRVDTSTTPTRITFDIFVTKKSTIQQTDE